MSSKDWNRLPSNIDVKKLKTKGKTDRVEYIDLNLHVVSEVKSRLSVDSLHDTHISNLLKLKYKDVEDLEIGKRELSIKDMSLICHFYGIHPDSLFDGYKPKDKE